MENIIPVIEGPMYEIEMLLEVSKNVKPSEKMIRHHVIQYNHAIPAPAILDVALFVDRFDETVTLYRLGLPLADILNELELYRRQL